MKRLSICAAMACLGLSSPAMAVTFTNYTIEFTNGTTNITPQPATAPGEYQDNFAFALTGSTTFSGVLSTQRLRDLGGNIVSDLDFGNSLPGDGVYLTGGTLAGELQFALPVGNTDALKVENLSTTTLGAGNYLLTVNYTVNAADSLHAATYAGPLFASSSPAGVPEPASWAMFIVGFGSVGYGLRSQRRKSLTSTV